MAILKIRRSQLDVLGDYWLSLTAFIQSILMLFQSLIADSGVIAQEMAALLRILLSIVVVGVAMFWILGRKLKQTIFVYTLFTFLFAISILLGKENTDYIIQEGLRFTYPICIPIFLSVISIKNIRILLHVSLLISYIGAFIGIVYAILFVTGNLPMLEDMYNMAFGYALLLPTLFLIYFDKNKILITFLILAILLAGSRGPLIPIFILILAKMFTAYSKKKIFFIFTSILLIFLALFPILLNYLSDIGINSRTLFLLLDGSFDSDSGRGDIYTFVWEKVLERPLIGYGFFADRVFLGMYCHNIFMEMFLNWGIFIPLFLYIIIMYVGLYLYRIINEEERLLLILLFSSSVIPLLLSSSYLIDFRLPIFMGVIYVYINKYSILKRY
ncbi:O-antigen ligase family protein [Bacteroides sp.]|uniref:O-antigen ligase family protein n=1 Tax=Bacteroides sp. TaxID=29523 RepID=UPI00259077DB|nr:O-antigen ligase family protein [Bacteroides sp.]